MKPLTVLVGNSGVTYDPAGTIIDFICVPESINSNYTSVIPFACSSHNLVLSNLQIQVSREVAVYHYSFSHEIDKDLYQECLHFGYENLWCPVKLLNPDLDLLNDLHRYIVHWASCTAFKYLEVGKGKACPWWTPKLSLIFWKVKKTYHNLILVKSLSLNGEFCSSRSISIK